MKKKITIRDLAKEAGVSVTTVSQILNNKGDRFSTATQERVLALRDKYKYVPDFNARNLILKSAKTIGVLVPNIANPFFGTFVEGVQSIAREAEFIPLVFSANRDPKLEKYYLSQMIERSISGLVIASATMTTETIKEVISFNEIPYIYLTRIIRRRVTGYKPMITLVVKLRLSTSLNLVTNILPFLLLIILLKT